MKVSLLRKLRQSRLLEMAICCALVPVIFSFDVAALSICVAGLLVTIK